MATLPEYERTEIKRQIEIAKQKDPDSQGELLNRENLHSEVLIEIVENFTEPNPPDDVSDNPASHYSALADAIRNADLTSEQKIFLALSNRDNRPLRSSIQNALLLREDLNGDELIAILEDFTLGSNAGQNAWNFKTVSNSKMISNTIKAIKRVDLTPEQELTLARKSMSSEQKFKLIMIQRGLLQRPDLGAESLYHVLRNFPFSRSTFGRRNIERFTLGEIHHNKDLYDLLRKAIRDNKHITADTRREMLNIYNQRVVIPEFPTAKAAPSGITQI